MRYAAAGLEACGVAGLEHGLAVVFLKNQFAFDHVDELVLLLVPVAQRGGRARPDAGDIDAELGQTRCVADPLLFAPGNHGGKFPRIGRDLLRRNLFDLDSRHHLSLCYRLRAITTFMISFVPA
jgi:hypothetical protein